MPHDVSVLVTAYNQNSTLEIVLKKLLQQDFQGSWEIIVCDDGSDEDTLSIVKHISRTTGPPIRYVWQSRNGERRARSRNNGLRLATGRIVIFVDGDIAVKQDFISAHVACHTGGRTAVCGSRYWIFMDDYPSKPQLESAIESLMLKNAELLSLYTEIWFQKQYADSQPWATCLGGNFSFSRDQEAIFFDERFVGWGAEDQEFACRLLRRHHYALRFDPSLFGFHLDQGKSSGHTKVRPRSPAEIEDYLRNIVYFCGQYPDEQELYPACIGIGHFELDPSRNIWQSAKEPRFSKKHIRYLLLTAQEWLAAGKSLKLASGGCQRKDQQSQHPGSGCDRSPDTA